MNSREFVGYSSAIETVIASQFGVFMFSRRSLDSRICQVLWDVISIKYLYRENQTISNAWLDQNIHQDILSMKEIQRATRWIYFRTTSLHWNRNRVIIKKTHVESNVKSDNLHQIVWACSSATASGDFWISAKFWKFTREISRNGLSSFLMFHAGTWINGHVRPERISNVWRLAWEQT